MVDEDDNATLGAVWFVVAIAFDYQAGHGVYHGVDLVIYKALFLLLIDLYPNV